MGLFYFAFRLEKSFRFLSYAKTISLSAIIIPLKYIFFFIKHHPFIICKSSCLYTVTSLFSASLYFYSTREQRFLSRINSYIIFYYAIFYNKCLRRFYCYISSIFSPFAILYPSFFLLRFLVFTF